MKVTLTIETIPGKWPAPPARRLAMWLKTGFRAFGFRVINAKEESEHGTDKKPTG
jgi:hypothetical protein